jgi:hypothetical protein
MSPFERLRPVSDELADRGTKAMEALKISPELGCAALRTWLEVGAVAHLESRYALPAFTGTDNELRTRIDRLADEGIIGKQQQGKFHKIRMEGNNAAHGKAVQLSTAHNCFRYAAAIGDWLLTESTAPQRAPSKKHPTPSKDLPDALEAFYCFRTHRAEGNSVW